MEANKRSASQNIARKQADVAMTCQLEGVNDGCYLKIVV